MSRVNDNNKKCYSCGSWDVIKNGKTSEGQRYRCKNCGRTFVCQEYYHTVTTAKKSASKPKLPSKGESLFLCLLGFIGIAGLHRLANKKTLSGLLYLFTFGLFGVGTILDLISYFMKEPIIPSNPLIDSSASIDAVASTHVAIPHQVEPKETPVFTFDEAVKVYVETDHQTCSSKYQYKQYFAVAFDSILQNIPKHQIELSNEKVLRKREIELPISDYRNITKSSNRAKLGNFIAIDTETTGLKTGGNDIIEICAIKFQNFRPTSFFHTYLKPRKAIPLEATAINHITNEMVADAPTFAQIKNDLQNFIDGFPLVAHNAEFDMKFLHVSGLDLAAHEKLVYDTLKLSRLKLRDYKGEKFYNYKLQTICDEQNIVCSNFHSASVDTLACGLVFIDIVKTVFEVESL